MKKGKILDVKERDLAKVGEKHVIIEKDEDYSFNPILENDNLFYLHSNITREFCANESEKNYPGLPIEEIEDEDGCGTGEYQPKEGVVIFPVAAYIHSGIVLSLGSGSHFPDQMWDVTRNAAYMWTDKERFCEFCGKENWMCVYDKELRKWRPAKDEDEFRSYLRTQAEGLLDEWQMWNDGSVYGFRCEESYVPYKRLYPDGHTEDEVDWKDGDSCWGFITDKANDIGFPRGDGWRVFDATGQFVGDEYDIPEFVVTFVPLDGVRQYLTGYAKNGKRYEAVCWGTNKIDAVRFPSWWQAQSVAQDVIEKGQYDAYKNCVEVDSL